MDDSLDPKVWLKRAKGNLSRANMTKTDDQFYEDYCFDCQQCAEKALKGLIVYLGLTPERTHYFEKLLKELSKRIILPDWIEDVFELSDYAVMTRYPDDYREVPKEEYLRAVEIAERVYNWVKESIK